MESDSSPVVSAKPPPLNSDQLNYLIWRYLQESGYGEAAVKLQRDWKVDAESLPFAKYIKGQALVSLVQKGLRYHHLLLTIDENGRPSKQLNPSMFFFGPESVKQSAEVEDSTPARQPNGQRAPSPASSTAAPRKHRRESGPNGVADLSHPGSKRSRKGAKESSSDRNSSVARKTSATTTSNTNANLSVMDVDMSNGHAGSLADARSPSTTEAGGEENGAVLNGVRPDDRMDVDDDALTTAAERPGQDVHIAPPIMPTLQIGESVGVQVAPAKVANLGPSTTILSLAEDRHVTGTAWQPGPVDVLTAKGDTFCGLWKLGDSVAASSPQEPVFQDLVDPTEGSLVSAVAWEPNGEMLAVATFSHQSGQVHLFDGQELGLLETLPASQRAITCLQWHSRGLRLLGIAPYDDQSSLNSGASSILLWDLSGSPRTAGPLSVTVPETLVDMDCASYAGNGIVCTAGEHAVYYCRAFSELEVEQKWTSPATSADQWSFVKCAWRGRHDAMLVAASAETARLWMPAQNLVKDAAHSATITALEIRPRAVNSFDGPTKQEFATSSLDGTIKVWQYDELSNSIDFICKVIIGHASPLMALSYSPDGFCLAGASYDTIRIWNAEHGHHLMASWQGPDHDWKGARLRDDDLVSTGGLSSMNGDAPQTSADHSLTWNGDSKKLVLGLGSQVAIINFQR